MNTDLNCNILTILELRTFDSQDAARGCPITTGAHEVMNRGELQLHFTGGGGVSGPLTPRGRTL